MNPVLRVLLEAGIIPAIAGTVAQMAASTWASQPSRWPRGEFALLLGFVVTWVSAYWAILGWPRSFPGETSSEQVFFIGLLGAGLGGVGAWVTFPFPPPHLRGLLYVMLAAVALSVTGVSVAWNGPRFTATFHRVDLIVAGVAILVAWRAVFTAPLFYPRWQLGHAEGTAPAAESARLLDPFRPSFVYPLVLVLIAGGATVALAIGKMGSHMELALAITVFLAASFDIRRKREDWSVPPSLLLAVLTALTAVLASSAAFGELPGKVALGFAVLPMMLVMPSLTDLSSSKAQTLHLVLVGAAICILWAMTLAAQDW